MACGNKWIIYHVLSESAVSSIFAGILSIVLAGMLLPQFNSLFDKQFNFFSVVRLLLPLFLIFFVFGIITGLYPAYQSLKPETTGRKGFNSFGKSLVTFQNVISIAMISGIFLIWSQIHFMKNYDLGFNKEQVIIVKIPSDPKQSPGIEAVRQELSKLPEIKSLAFGGGGTNLGTTGNWLKSIMVTKDAHENDIQFIANQPFIDENYIDLLGIKIIKGRNFSETMQEDKNQCSKSLMRPM